MMAGARYVTRVGSGVLTCVLPCGFRKWMRDAGCRSLSPETWAGKMDAVPRKGSVVPSGGVRKLMGNPGFWVWCYDGVWCFLQKEREWGRLWPGVCF